MRNYINLDIKKGATHGNTLSHKQSISCIALQSKGETHMSYKKFQIIKQILKRANMELSTPKALNTAIKLNKQTL